MNKVNGLLIVVVFIQILIISILCCYAWQRDKNEKLLFEQVKREIIILEEKNSQQDELIGAIIRTEAMQGKFDKKE